MEHTTSVILLSKIGTAFGTVWLGVTAILLAVFVQVSELVLLTYVMIFLHMVSGFCLSWKERTGWSEQKWFRNAMKFLWFPVVIVANALVEYKFSLPVPLPSIVAGYLIMHDMKGLVENVGKLTGVNLWEVLAEYISKKKDGKS